jgi:putative ABC transport system ATP-binding protein
MPNTIENETQPLPQPVPVGVVRRLGAVPSANLGVDVRDVAGNQVELPLIYRRSSNRRKVALRALSEVGLVARAKHRPTQMSGGEQQRVAIARALVSDPALILADEPTGALDTKTSGDIMDILVALNARRKITVVIVTHEPEIAAYADRVIQMRDGRKVSDAPATVSGYFRKVTETSA